MQFNMEKSIYALCNIGIMNPDADETFLCFLGFLKVEVLPVCARRFSYSRRARHGEQDTRENA